MKLRSATGAAKESDRALVKRIGKTRDLFAYFGIKTYGYDPGVCGVREDGASVNFGRAEFSWIVPLLEELREHRTGKRHSAAQRPEEGK